MTRPEPRPEGVIRRDAVRLLSQPAMVDCTAGEPGKGPISVVPLLDGDRVAGLQIRCSCGAGAVIECVYETESKP
jgi:hypothetical protein